jgi:hypothetical protein
MHPGENYPRVLGTADIRTQIEIGSGLYHTAYAATFASVSISNTEPTVLDEVSCAVIWGFVEVKRRTEDYISPVGV